MQYLSLKSKRILQNFYHSSLRAYLNHPKHHQGHQPLSGTSISLINVIDAFKLNRFQPNFKPVMQQWKQKRKHEKGVFLAGSRSGSSKNGLFLLPSKRLQIFCGSDYQVWLSPNFPQNQDKYCRVFCSNLRRKHGSQSKSRSGSSRWNKLRKWK